MKDKMTLNDQLERLNKSIEELKKHIINGFVCEIIGIYRTIVNMRFISGHDFEGNNAYGELKCKRCGYVSKGDPRYDFSNAEKGKFYRGNDENNN